MKWSALTVMLIVANEAVGVALIMSASARLLYQHRVLLSVIRGLVISGSVAATGTAVTATLLSPEAHHAGFELTVACGVAAVPAAVGLVLDEVLRELESVGGPGRGR